jgi:hypothetical protein
MKMNESKMIEEINKVEDKITKYENKVINRRGEGNDRCS